MSSNRGTLEENDPVAMSRLHFPDVINYPVDVSAHVREVGMVSD